MITKITRRDALQFMTAGVSATVVMVKSPEAHAAAFPSRPITMVCPYAPGGYVDDIARVITPSLSKAFTQPVSVVDTPGADGMLGQEYYLQQPNDGYVLLADSVTNIIQNVLIHHAPFRYDDFWMINLPAQDFTLLATAADNDKIKSINDVISALKKDPASLSVGVAPATADYVNLVLFFEAIGIDIKQLRLVTADSGPLRTDVIGGVVDIGFSGGQGFEPLAGQIRPLLTFDATRRTPYDAPSVTELKLSTPLDIVPGSLRGFACHKTFKDKYPDRYNTVVSAYEGVFKDPKTTAMLTTQNLASDWYGPERSNEIYNHTFVLMQKYASLLKGV